MTLSCSASAIPLPNVTWEKEGGAIPSTTTVFTTLSDTPNTVSTIISLTMGVRNIANYGSDNKMSQTRVQSIVHSLP